MQLQLYLNVAYYRKKCPRPTLRLRVEMTQLYKQVDEVIARSGTIKGTQRTPSYADIRTLVHDCVNVILGLADLHDESDIFRAGADR